MSAPSNRSDMTDKTPINSDLDLDRLRRSAFLLLQNCEGCAVNHYGEDYQGVMPGWLADCRRDLEQGFAALSIANQSEPALQQALAETHNSRAEALAHIERLEAGIREWLDAVGPSQVQRARQKARALLNSNRTTGERKDG